MTLMTQNFIFLNFFCLFLYYWLFLNSYHIDLRKMFGGSQMKILWKIYGLNGFDTFFLPFSIEFLVFAFFVVVLIVIRLIVMSLWLPMHDKHKYTPIKESLSVFIDFCWKLLNLMAVKLKIFFRKFFLNALSILLQTKLTWLVVLSSTY